MVYNTIAQSLAFCIFKHNERETDQESQDSNPHCHQALYSINQPTMHQDAKRVKCNGSQSTIARGQIPASEFAIR